MPNGEIFVTDNQGGWLPASKLIEIKPGEFYNHYTTEKDGTPGRFDDQPVTKPVLWMPQNEIANSPSTPVIVEGGPYAGQMFIGDVTYGGLQRADLEKVDGRQQGALFRMTQGLEAGVSRVLKGPDGSLIIGGLGAGGNWGQTGKLRYGLQKLDLNETVPFDMLSMDVVEGGFEIEYTQPLSAATLDGPRLASTRSSSGATAPPRSTAVPSSTRRRSTSPARPRARTAVRSRSRSPA